MNIDLGAWRKRTGSDADFDVSGSPIEVLGRAAAALAVLYDRGHMHGCQCHSCRVARYVSSVAASALAGQKGDIASDGRFC